jgi:hypothetical protein
MTDVNQMLKNGEAHHGKFTGHAEISVTLKSTVHGFIAKRGKQLSTDKIEALDMMCHKMARIINGDPEHADHWIDIAGYATLVANDLEASKKPKTTPEPLPKNPFQNPAGVKVAAKVPGA